MNIMQRTLYIASILLVIGSVAHAGFYKGVDAEGNVVYSDTPIEGSVEFTPPGISTVESLKVAPKTETTKTGEGDDQAKKPPTVYTRFSIKQPDNETTIWDNNGNIPVELSLTPQLDKENGHKIWVLVNNKPIIKNGENLVAPMSGFDRGTHKIRAEVRSGNKVLIKTGTITVYLKKASALNRGGG